MLNPVNGHLSLACGEMDFIRFGNGERILVMLPGVGDGFKTVKDTALPFALMYRAMADDFTVYMFSRRRDLAPDMTTRQMADDLNEAMEALEIHNACVMGVSQGGMIAQWLAIDHPEKIEKLVLVVTLARPNKTVKQVISRWLKMADKDFYRGILLDTAERSYTEEKLKTARVTYRILGNISKPESYERFKIQANSCITHDAYEELEKITCPTLVIGGTDDKIVTGEASEEIAIKIPGALIYMYPGLGHGLYEEAPDFIQRVMNFCMV